MSEIQGILYVVVTKLSFTVLSYNCIGLLWGLDSICKLLKNYINLYSQMLKINSYCFRVVDMVVEDKKR